MNEEEMIEILEGIARDSPNGVARIAAIRALREMESGREISTNISSSYRGAPAGLAN